MDEPRSPYLRILRNRIDLKQIPFTERGSGLLLLRNAEGFAIRLAERWLKRDLEPAAYRSRSAMVEDLQVTDGEGNRLAVEVTTYPPQRSCKPTAHSKQPHYPSFFLQ